MYFIITDYVKDKNQVLVRVKTKNDSKNNFSASIYESEMLLILKLCINHQYVFISKHSYIFAIGIQFIHMAQLYSMPEGTCSSFFLKHFMANIVFFENSHTINNKEENKDFNVQKSIQNRSLPDKDNNHKQGMNIPTFLTNFFFNIGG